MRDVLILCGLAAALFAGAWVYAISTCPCRRKEDQR